MLAAAIAAIDIALHEVRARLPGVPVPATMDGSVLHEALVHSTTPTPTPKVKTLESKSDIGLYHWEQYLKFTTVGTTRYFDEGNGMATRR